MARRLVWLAVLPLLLVSATVQAQTLRFWAETLDVPPDSGCVQVGLFLNYSGMDPGCSTLHATLNYSADMMVLGGIPEARLSDFASMVMQPGLTNPPTPQPAHGGMTMCSPKITTNSVVLGGGMEIPFMGSSMGGPAMVMETVNDMMGRIELQAFGDIETLQGEDLLFAILTFPVSGSLGTVHVDFSMATMDANSLGQCSAVMTLPADTTGGSIRVGGGYPVPTLAEWGIIVFIVGIILSMLFVSRRRPVSC